MIETPPNPTEVKNVTGNRSRKIYLLIIGAQLLILVAVILFFVYPQMRQQFAYWRTPSPVGPTANTNTAPPPPETPEPPTPSQGLTVAWREYPLEVTPSAVTDSLGITGEARAEVHNFALPDYEQASYYKVGTVTSAPYEGQDLLIAFVPCYGPCFSQPMMRLIVDRANQRLVNVSAYGPSKDEIFWERSDSEMFAGPTSGIAPPGRRIVDDPLLRIPDLDLPAQTTFNSATGGTATLIRPAEPVVRFATKTDVTEVGRTVDGRVIFSVKDYHCLVLKRPDHTFVEYRLSMSFLSDQSVPQITWNDGSVNTADYVFGEIGGCGFTSCYSVRTDADFSGSGQGMIDGGVLSNGDRVFVPAAESHADFQDAYRDSTAYVAPGTSKKTIQQFIAERPIFFWKDPLGRWIRFIRRDALPAVECGKPVIYLYPQKEMSVHVSVGLKGNMTVSEPPHGARGWDVVAKTDGYVVNKADGQTYPNLFWEGTGVHYKTPKQGFVVAGDGVDSWLIATLAKIGFTTRESAEFREFWVPRLPKSPYLFITFVPQSDFDRDAPLLITPRPDSVSRVFMEYRPLSAPESVEALPLPKIERDGFAVVEWGGALR